MNPTALPRPATIRARIHESAVSRVTRAYGDRIVRFCGCDGPVFENGWIRESRE